jgi:hypothetical protein
MTVHVSGRSISALLLFSVSLLGLPANALAQSVQNGNALGHDGAIGATGSDRKK